MLKRSFIGCSLLTFMVVLISVLLMPTNASASTNISYQKPYYIGGIGAHPSYPDTNGQELTDGSYGTNSYADARWLSLYQFGETEVYITCDLRFASSVESVSLNFLQNTGAGIYYPASVKYTYSADGQFYTYLGDGVPQTELNSTKKYTLTLGSAVNAKYVRAIVAVNTLGQMNFVDEMEVMGTSTYSNSTKFAISSYTTSVAADSSYPDSGNAELRDGIVSTGGYTDSAWSGRWLSSNSFYSVTVDLGSNKNVSEVMGRFLKDANSSIYNPSNVKIYTSTNGSNFTFIDYSYGVSMLKRNGSDDANNVWIYRLTVPYTVSARYVKFEIFGSNQWIMSDELEVYGQASVISPPTPAPTADPLPIPTVTPNISPQYTNIAKGKTYTSSLAPSASYPDTGNIELTDTKFGDGRSFTDSRWSGYNTSSSFSQVVDLGQSYNTIQGAQVEFMQDTASGIYYPSNVSFSYSTDGINYQGLGDAVPSIEVEKKKLYKLEFANKTARYIKITINVSGSQWVFEDEIQVFKDDVQRPAIRGGFLQIPVLDTAGTDVGDRLSRFTAAQWQREIQAMKELGMEFIVIQYGADSKKKTTLYPNPTVTGYTHNTSGYGTSDPIETIMTEADKYKMKVLLGGVVNYNDCYAGIRVLPQTERTNWINNQVRDGNTVFGDLYTKYGNHSSFYGFYLADEASDDWLRYNNGQGVDDFRAIYKGQSDYIRANYPGAKIMISPATWTTTSADQFATDIYNLLVNGYGGNPVVDIVAQQDSIGARWSGNPPVYTAHEERIQAVSNKVRDVLGIEYWLDTEIFEAPYYIPMSLNEMPKSLVMESKYANISIVFDISHYLDPQISPSDAWEPTQTYYDYLKYYESLDLRNLALNRSYTSSMAANASYPDTNSVELTDGKSASTVNFDNQWQGRTFATPFSYSFTIDLGSIKSVRKFVATFLKDTGSSIILPNYVAFETSTDNITFTARGTAYTPAILTNSVGEYSINLGTDSSINARYIKATIDSPAGWSFIDQFKVLK